MHSARIAHPLATTVAVVATLLIFVVPPAPAAAASSGRDRGLCAARAAAARPACPATSAFRCAVSTRWAARYRAAGLRCVGRSLRPLPRRGRDVGRPSSPVAAPAPLPQPAPTPTPEPTISPEVPPASVALSSGPYAIVFSSAGEIWAGDDAAGARTRVSPAAGEHYHANPALSPDERTVVYDRDGHELWLAPPGGDGDPALLFAPGDPWVDAWQPSFHPSGDTVLFTSGSDLYTVATDGTGLRAITRTAEEAEQDGAFSPDGRTIAFSDRGRLGLMNPDGSDVRYLTAAFDWSAWGPRWSPDGGRLTFYAFTPTGSDVFEVRTDGTGLRNVTASAKDEQLPDFAPDGASLLFDRDDDGDFVASLWHAAADGSGATEVASGSASSGSYRQPSTLPAEG